MNLLLALRNLKRNHLYIMPLSLSISYTYIFDTGTKIFKII